MEDYTNNKPITTKPSGKKQRITIPHILGGDILKEDFVMKQSKLLILIAFLSILFISNRYSCMKKLTEIESLKRELKDIKYEHLLISNELTSNSRQSQIEELLKEKNMDLTSSKMPPVEIEK